MAKKNHQIKVWTSREVKDKLEECVKSRIYFDPDDDYSERNFDSINHYLNFLIQVTNLFSAGKWRLFVSLVQYKKL